MRVTPVSGDLVVKAVMVVGGVALAVWAVGRARQAAGDAAASAWNGMAQAAEGAYNWAGNAVQYVNPASPQNFVYTGLNDVLFPARDQTIGTWLYDVMHPAPEPEFVGPPDIYENANWDGFTGVMLPANGTGADAVSMWLNRRGGTGGASGSW